MKSWNCVPVDIWRSVSRLWISRGDGSRGPCGGDTGCVRRLFVKPASPLWVWLVGVVKPVSPLRARMGVFWAVGAVHWCCGFQVRVSAAVHWCCGFQVCVSVPTQWPTSYMHGRLESSGCSSGPTNLAGAASCSDDAGCRPDPVVNLFAATRPHTTTPPALTSRRRQRKPGTAPQQSPQPRRCQAPAISR